MNLHGIVAGVIGAVNPQVMVQIQISTGSTAGPDGKRVPTYAPVQSAQAQIQALQYNDIVQADGMNIQGVRRKIYVYGEIDGLVRASNKGGDLITLPDGTVWKVAMILEAWPDWTCAAITLQNGP